MIAKAIGRYVWLPITPTSGDIMPPIAFWDRPSNADRPPLFRNDRFIIIEVVRVKSIPNWVTVRKMRTMTTSKLLKNRALRVSKMVVNTVVARTNFAWIISGNRAANPPGIIEPMAIPIPFKA